MDKFQAMQVFTRVVDANSFTRAAESLGLPRTTVTNMLQNLESLLHVRLLNRTTRRLSLTPDGAAYYERCVRILGDVEETEALFLDAKRGPRGRLRIDVPPSIGRLMLLPKLGDFHTRYPEIELVFGMSDRPVDMVREQVDCVIRIGELQDSSMVARRIGTLHSVTCAAPAYLEQYGEPRTIAELQQHRAVHYFSSRTGRDIDWDFVVDGVATEVKVKGAISVNDGEAYVACALQGMGMIQPPLYMVKLQLQSGLLREILPQWSPSPMPIFVGYLHNRHLSPKVRAFVDWVAELFAECPLLNGRGIDYLNAAEQECVFAGKPGENTVRQVVQKYNFAESVL